MKFSIQREALLAPITQVIGVVERRQTLPVLANFLIEAEGDQIRITGTDMEVEMVARASADVAEEGAITVPARKLVDICRALPESQTLNIQLADDKVALHAGRSRFSLSTLPPAEFPATERIEPLAEYQIPEQRLRRLVQNTAFAMANQDVRQYLNGLLLEFRDGMLRAVSTDGHRLALAEVAADISGEARQVIVPRKGVLELSRTLEDVEEPVRVVVGGNYIKVDRPKLVISSKLIDGRFPDYEAVIPIGLDRGVVTDRDALIHALHRAAILSNEKYRGVRLEIAKQAIRIVAHNPQQEEAIDEVGAEHEFDQLTIGFNVNYLMDALNALRGEKAHLALKDANSSCMVTDPEDAEVRQVVMPLKL